MTSLLPAALALFVAGQLPLATEVELPGGQRVLVEADLGEVDTATGSVEATGNVLLRAELATLRADRVVFDNAAQTALASGNVMLVSGEFAAVAEEIRVDLRSQEATLKGGLFMQKKGVSSEALQAAESPKQLREMGETPVLLSGERIRRNGERGFIVDELTFTPCECSTGDPTWRVEAKSADVKVGERAILRWPVVYVHSLPVFAVPWLYLPLATRRTGLLVPKPTSSSLNGFIVEQPVFFTLGDSYDLTLTPGYYTGGRSDLVPHGDVEVREPRQFGIEGPRLQSEFRYVPSPRTNGRATFGLLYDLRPERMPVFGYLRRAPTAEDPVPSILDRRRGLRWEGSLQHRQELATGLDLRADVALVSDGDYTRDLVADLIARESGYLRSSAVLAHRTDDSYLGLDVTVRQDLRGGWGLFRGFTFPDDASLPFYAIDGQRTLRGPQVLQRLPNITALLPERALVGPFTTSLRAEFSRLSPLTSNFGDEGVDGRDASDRQFSYVPFASATLANRRELDRQQADGVFQANEREARMRLNLLPRLSASVPLGPVVRLTTSAAVRQDLFYGERTGRTGGRGHPVFGAVLDAQALRDHPLRGGRSLRHVVTPSVELRAVPFGWGQLPASGPRDAPGAPALYDELDLAVPGPLAGRQPHAVQAVVSVDQKLMRREGDALTELFRLELGQGFDLSRPLFGGKAGPAEETPFVREAFARLAGRAGVVGASAVVRVDPRPRACPPDPSKPPPMEGEAAQGRKCPGLTQVGGNLTIDNGKGEAIWVDYQRLLDAGSERLRAGSDTLFGPYLSGRQVAEQVFTGARLTFTWGLGLRYQALLQPRARGPRNLNANPLAEQTLGVSYGPACDCWRFEAFAVLRRDPILFTFDPLRGDLRDFGFNLTIARFGTFGSGR